MRKSFWLGFAAYLIPSFPLGYFWHLTTFAEQYAKLQMYREHLLIPAGLGSMLIQAVFYSWAYPKLFNTERNRWLLSAAMCALVFGVFAWSYTTLPVAAKYRMTSVGDFVILESAFTALQFAVVAPLLALAHRRS